MADFTRREFVKSWQDAVMAEAESKKAVVSHGASVHGLPALRRAPGNEWLNVAMIRVTVGYKSTSEIDEAIENLNLALA